MGKQIVQRREPPQIFSASSIRWTSDKEFEGRVFPSAFRNNEHVRLSHRLYTLVAWLQEAEHEVRALYKVTDELRKLSRSTSDLNEAVSKAAEACIVGERLLLHNKRLALSEYAEEFLHIKDAFASENDNRKRAGHWDLDHLLKGLDDLSRGLNVLQKGDEFFLTLELNLPKDLKSDFYTARDCFSVGLDEPGLFVAGRGLEGVFRRILRERKVTLQTGAKVKPAAEAEFHDVIEVARRLRWRKDGNLIFSQDTIQLLHWLRTIRNREAHPAASTRAADARTRATLVAETANSFWTLHSTYKRAQLKDTLIIKTW